jgi:hypothetical protein
MFDMTDPLGAELLTAYITKYMFVEQDGPPFLKFHAISTIMIIVIITTIITLSILVFYLQIHLA